MELPPQMQCGYLILFVTHICYINGLLSRVMRSVTQCQCQGKDVLNVRRRVDIRLRERKHRDEDYI